MRRYFALEPKEKTVLEILAVYYVPGTQTLVYRVFAALGVKGKGGRRFSSATLRPFIVSLVERGLILRGTKIHLIEELREPIARLLLEEGRFAAIAEAIEAVEPVKTPTSTAYRTLSRGDNEVQGYTRALRVALYTGAFDRARKLLEAVSSFERSGRTDLLGRFYDEPFTPTLLDALPLDLFDEAMVQISLTRDARRGDEGALFDYIVDKGALMSDTLNLRWALYLIRGSRLDEAGSAITGRSTWRHLALGAWLKHLGGDLPGALAAYTNALASFKRARRASRSHGPREPFFETFEGAFYLLALLEQKEYADVSKLISDASDGYAYGGGHPLELSFGIIASIADTLQGRTSADKPPIVPAPLPAYLWALGARLSQSRVSGADRETLRSVAETARRQGSPWLEMHILDLLGDLCDDPDATATAREWRETHELRFCHAGLSVKPAWALKLEALERVGAGPLEAPSALSGRDKRMAWALGPPVRGHVSIQPLEQKISSVTGAWTNGRKLSLEQLFRRRHKYDYLTKQDKKVLATLERDSHSYYGISSSYAFDKDRALEALIGHPLLVRADDREIHLTLELAQPTLKVEQRDQRLAVTLEPPLSGDGVMVIADGPTRLLLYKATRAHHDISKIVGDGLEMPARARERLMGTLGALASLVDVEASVAGAGMSSQQAQQVEADPTPVVQLSPMGEGLYVVIRVRPLGERGPERLPGVGGETVMTRVGDESLQTTRLLDLERKRLAALIDACPALEALDAAFTTSLSDSTDSLQLLLQLQRAKARLEWPKGESMMIRQELSAENLNLTVQGRQDWFEVSGDVVVDEALTIELHTLLKMLEEESGPFLRLAPGSYAALTDDLRARLAELATAPRHKGQVRLHPMASHTLDPLLEGAGSLSLDAGYAAWRARLELARTAPIDLPTTLKATLRDYQVEGFRWLARLAQMGGGACLADDMGLGKTLQTLALLLHRAELGPALVVAPASVSMNWLEEARRFAPTLSVARFGPGDRQATLDGLAPFSVIVCSYGLMQSERDRLSAVTFATVVLDEAQAIKNANTKRAKAASALDAGFRVALTGTPIENRLSELWSLFEFINPGMLSSARHFRQRFVLPIERDQDRDARRQLRKLLLPFILRRTKAQVLDELPERTEVTLRIEMEPDEAAFYEALRRRAVEVVDASGDQKADQRFTILAQLTRLRRACCNPALVAEEIAPPASAKLSAFAELVESLADGGHKALVFSQFVDHLSILRRWLDAREIVYQYLDGSTPIEARAAAVRAFQSGVGDLFLISLRAGGVGLNLTAADYVIHMDPWWNPAVEDQASDRAHRIGQTRPVTIYRLVTVGTVEEKIVALHERKRDLADSLLEGANMAGALSAEELVALIKGA